jgi:hypothetical protein
MIENQNQPDMFNANDWYETVAVFKCKRNWFFFFILICLLLLQATFWANNMGWVDTDNNDLDNNTSASEAASATLTATDGIQSAAESAGDGISDMQNQYERTALEITGQPSNADKYDPLNVVQKELLKDSQESKSLVDKFVCSFREKPSHKLISSVVRVCNFILVIASTLYCLTLLMAIKVSLCGRLGGLAYITKAFFASLFMLVIIMPWQNLFPGIVLGMIFTPAELFSHTGVCAATCQDQSRLIGDILYYLRFCGLWLIVIIALFTAQIRSGKWAKIINNRLGIVR